jgi:hypothetical protein
MFKKLKILTSLLLVASVASLTIFTPVNSQAGWGDQFEWIGSFSCNDYSKRWPDLSNSCWLIHGNKNYDSFGKLGFITPWAYAIRPVAMANRAVACNLYGKKVWGRNANYGEPGNYGEVKCWNKRW